MIGCKFDAIDFRAFSNLVSVALCSMGLLSFWLSNHRTSTGIILFLWLLLFSLIIRFAAIYIISRDVGRVIFTAFVPICWFIFFCFSIGTGSLNDEYLNFWMGLFLAAIGVLRIFQSFDALIAPFRLLIIALGLIDILVGFFILFDWPSSLVWNTWIILGVDLISTSITLYLFSTNLMKIEQFFNDKNPL